MKITILCVGKVKESFYRGGISEFEKRLSRYTNLDIIEVADEQTPDKASEAQEEQIKEKEAKRLLTHVKEDDFVCTLEIQGKEFTSVDFSKWIAEKQVSGVSHITFVIGGSLGLHESVLKRSDFALSFSKMTFPHQLMRLILCEQIYRAFRIMNGEPYHK